MGYVDSRSAASRSLLSWVITMSIHTEITASDYIKYRGKCKQLCDAACVADPSLTLVRGHYFCPIWNTNEPHWWTVRPNGEIYDPTKNQFPSKGLGEYVPFDGVVKCAECGKKMKEAEARFDSNYAFCSSLCNMRFVGL